MKRAVRTAGRPPAIERRPRIAPLSRLISPRHHGGSDLAAVIGDRVGSSAIKVRSVTGPSPGTLNTSSIRLRSQGLPRIALSMSAEFAEFALQQFEMPVDGPHNPALGGAATAVALGDDHLDDPGGGAPVRLQACASGSAIGRAGNWTSVWEKVIAAAAVECLRFRRALTVSHRYRGSAEGPMTRRPRTAGRQSHCAGQDRLVTAGIASITTSL